MQAWAFSKTKHIFCTLRTCVRNIICSKERSSKIHYFPHLYHRDCSQRLKSRPCFGSKTMVCICQWVRISKRGFADQFRHSLLTYTLSIFFKATHTALSKQEVHDGPNSLTLCNNTGDDLFVDGSVQDYANCLLLLTGTVLHFAMYNEGATPVYKCHFNIKVLTALVCQLS